MTPRIAKAQGRPREVEFPAKVRDQADARAKGCCETCGLPFKGRPQYDHVLPAALGGQPTLANCRAICVPCHKAKTADDVGRIRKADRQRRADNGAKLPSKRLVQSAGFTKSEPKPKAGAARIDKSALPLLPRRPMFA